MHCYTVTLFNCAGDADEWLVKELLTERLAIANAANPNGNVQLQVRRRPQYNHGFYFVSTFLQQHFAWHADVLLADTPGYKPTYHKYA